MNSKARERGHDGEESTKKPAAVRGQPARWDAPR